MVVHVIEEMPNTIETSSEMRNWLHYIRSSFSARLSLWVTGIVTVIYLVFLYLIFQFSITLRDESLESIMQDLIEADHMRLLWMACLIMVTGLLVLLLICRILIDRNLKPLDLLADNVRRISDNHFEQTQDIGERKDEIGGLQSSFTTMQQKLADYINEINQKTDMLKQRQRELENAYERAQEDQRVKTAFLSNITQQLIQPVSDIHTLTSTLATNYHDFSIEDMNRMRAEIVLYTNEITLLIDQKLITSQQS